MSGGRSRWLVLVTAVVALFVLPGGGPAAASQPAHGLRAVPAPIDPTPGNRSPQRRGSARAVPRTIARNPLLKEVLSEEQEGADDPGRDLSALCQDFVGKPNPYRNPAPNVDQIVGDTIVTTGSQTGCAAAQNENTIAVNPNNPKNIVAGTNDYRLFNAREGRNDGSGWAYTSMDGGKSWKNIQLPKLTFQTGATGALSYMDSAGDPVIQFGPKNTVYYGNIVFSRATPASGGTEAASAIVVNVSREGGLHWLDPTIVAIDGVDRTGQPSPPPSSTTRSGWPPTGSAVAST